MNKKIKQGELNLSHPFKETGGEKLLQFIWGFGYYNSSHLTTTEGEQLSILSPGLLNKNQGPDFSAARIKIHNTILAGTIELHLKTSDWRRHHHEEDVKYKNVILHVVFEHDEKVNDIPVLELSSRISTMLLDRYSSFMYNRSFIPCSSNIAAIKDIVWASWKERLLAERLTRKSLAVLSLLESSNFHWEETFWWLLARNFGGKVNAEAFETIARSIPINLLAKHKASIHQIEALLFGQANLLEEEFTDDYAKLLQREYHFFKKKYKLQPPPVNVLFLRMRPGNFPTVRLAQLAVLIHQASHLFSTIIETEKLAEVKTLFDVTANDFWHYHYTFREASSFKKKTLGQETVHNIIINTVAPVLFSYGIYHKKESYKEKALRWLEELPAESNSITKEFFSLGIKNVSAYDSQALIELKNEYCAEKKCLDCSVGNYLLREAAEEYTTVKRF